MVAQYGLFGLVKNAVGAMGCEQNPNEASAGCEEAATMRVSMQPLINFFENIFYSPDFMGLKLARFDWPCKLFQREDRD